MQSEPREAGALTGIEKLNSQLRGCARCRLSETRTHVLPGEGNVQSRVMLVAQAPGMNEDREGRMFIGPSGKVLDEMLRRTCVKREELYITNLIKCMLPKYRRPKSEEIEACGAYLDREIGLICPRIIVPMGYYAIRYMFEKYGIPVPEKKEFHTVFGCLVVTQEASIYPVPHPAAVLYNEAIEEETAKKYRRLKVFLRACTWYPVCPMKRYYEAGALSWEWIARYCQGDWQSCVRYHMEERGEPHPDWMLPDGSVDRGLRDR